jgi:hypothetical protein
MPAVRLAAVVLAMLAFAPAAHAALPAPTGLKPFLLRADEAAGHTFARTPSFAWKPVKGAKTYEFELATRSSFPDGNLIWSAKNLKSPTTAIPVALPWMTGSPYALWAHVRAITRKGVTKWSAPFGFNMRWTSLPQPDASPAGLIRWTPVDGATGYHVWFLGPNKRIATRTNVADEREHWTFHQDPAWTATVRWRVRAVRAKIGSSANGMPAVSYGPWSPIYVHLNPPLASSVLSPFSMASDAYVSQATGFKLMPGLAYTGNTAGADAFSPGAPRQLYRVYISTDVDCVNIVYRGSIVGSPAWAPRTTSGLVLPANSSDLAIAQAGWIIGDGKNGKTFAVDNAAVAENESLQPTTSGGTGGTGGGGGGGETGGGTTEADKVEAASLTPPLVDLWDNGWPENRYYWTVVPVRWRPSITDPNLLEYQDTELPQDACASGRVFTFGKVSEAVTATAGAAPYVSGLSTTGKLFTAARARPKVYGSPLVAWKPALGADSYEVQWSKKAYPWTKTGGVETPSTSAALPLAPGKWFYRVRGISLALPVAGRQMSWSDPVALQVAKPTFRIVKR